MPQIIEDPYQEPTTPKPTVVDDYQNKVSKYKNAYSNSLLKYQVQVNQAEQDMKSTSRSAYINMMNGNRVRGDVMNSRGLGNSGYKDRSKVKDLVDYEGKYSGAIYDYNKTVQDVNMNISDSAFGYNQDLTDAYNTELKSNPNIKKSYVSPKRYGYK